MLTSSRYDHTDEDRWRVNPQLEVSMPKHWQVGISSRLTDDDRAGSRLVRLGVAHQFVVERNWIPNIASSFPADFPRGAESKGIDTRLKALLTKSLTYSPSKDRLHLNLAWVHNAAPLTDERNDYLRFAVGYSPNLRQQTVLVTVYSLEQRRSLGSVIRIAEIGLRQRLGKNTVYSVGVGAGATEATSELRASLGLEYSF